MLLAHAQPPGDGDVGTHRLVHKRSQPSKFRSILRNCTPYSRGGHTFDSREPSVVDSGDKDPSPQATEAAALGYEEARAELEEVVRKLESGGVTLEESLALWERGEVLAAACQGWLDGARAKLAAIRGGGEDPQV